ncbi:unnamed protein product [Caretta caretta]
MDTDQPGGAGNELSFQPCIRRGNILDSFIFLRYLALLLPFHGKSKPFIKAGVQEKPTWLIIRRWYTALAFIKLASHSNLIIVWWPVCNEFGGSQPVSNGQVPASPQLTSAAPFVISPAERPRTLWAVEAECPFRQQNGDSSRAGFGCGEDISSEDLNALIPSEPMRTIKVDKLLSKNLVTSPPLGGRL